MGCCCCFGTPTESILNDVSVVASATVGDVYIYYGDDPYSQNTFIGGGIRGLMYIKDRRLFYVCMGCGGRLCCCNCCGKSFDFAEITSVEVVQNQSFKLPVRRSTYGRIIWLNPGLKIVTKQHSSSNEVLVFVQMQDAQKFATHLRV